MSSMGVSTSKPIRLILLALLAGGLAIVNTSAGPATATPSGGGGKGGSITTITLITGDQVRVTRAAGGLRATAEAAPGRAGIAFGIQQHGDSTWVYPSDAVALIASGRLDRRLFEVSTLLEQGNADNVRGTIPLIIQHSKGKPVSALPGGALRDRELASASSTVVKQDKRSATRFWKWLTGSTRSLPGQRSAAGGALSAGVRKVWLDGRMTASLDRSVPQTGAPEAWKKGYTGKNVRVAVLDTGVDAAHLDLKGAVAAARNFSESPDTKDRFGHGTHVASIITGSGARSGGKYKGVAPDAVLLNGKVLDDGGSGSESSIIAGMEWAVAQQARVVNLSLGGWPNEGQDPVDLSLNELSRSSGALFVVAAGNSGPGRYSVTTPATATEALAVAATDRNQTTADFSSAGPRIGDYAVKPEIAAPGREIVAALAAGTQPGEPVGSYYVKLSGTSMATPHVAGAAAILAQQQPTWNARLLKSALMGTSRLPVNESVFRQGAGFLDVARAVNQKVFALEGSVSANLQWPHTQKAARTLTYRNPGASPLKLNLRFDPKDQNGVAAAAGVFGLPSSVTVPARTTAKVTLTIDPAKSRPGLLYHGRITATATGINVRTPVSVNVEPEMYDVSLDITDRNGDKVTSYEQGQLMGEPMLRDLTEPARLVQLRPKNGKWIARVPRGAYTITQSVLTPRAAGVPSSTLYSVPRIAVTAPTALTLDARTAKRATAVVDAPEARTTEIGTALVQLIDGEWVWHRLTLSDPATEPEAYVIASQQATRPFLFGLTQVMRATDGTYDLVFVNRGALPADPAYPAPDNELADLTLHLGMQGVAGNGYLTRSLETDDTQDGSSWTWRSYDVTLPETRRYLVSTSAGDRPVYATTYLSFTGESGNEEFAEETRASYPPGRAETVKLSAAAFSPRGSGIHTPGQLWIDFTPVSASGPGSTQDFRQEVRGSITLDRNGTRIATSANPYFLSADNATGTATYTAVMHGTRQVPWSVYGTRVSGTWRFTSTDPPGDEEGHVLPMITTRVTGAFDLYGRAPAGEVFPLTVNVSDAVGGVETVTLRVSYDEGKTWVSVPVSNETGEWVAKVRHPASLTNRFVALRVVAADARGNSTGWTAYRSYQLANLG